MKFMNGIGKLCLVFIFVSLPYASQSNSLNFAVDTKYSTKLKFSWDATTSVGGVIKEFKIECSRKNKFEIVKNKNRIDSSSNSYTIEGLGSYKKYICKLIVYSSSGTVAARASVSTRTLPGDVCSQPLGLENGALPDDQIEFPVNDREKKIFRLNSIGKEFDVNTDDVIFKFDFKRLIKVTGFAIKSFRSTNSKFYFKYQTFENIEKDFKEVQENGNNDAMKFQHPKDYNYTYRYRINDSPIIARYLWLFHDNNYFIKFSLKVEFYGCSEVCSNLLKHENISLEKNGVVSKISNPKLYSNEKVCVNQNDSLHYSFCSTVKLSGISILNKNLMGSQKIEFHILCSMNGRKFTAVDQSRSFGGTVDAGDVLTSWLVTEEYCKHIQLILVSPLNTCLQVQLLGCQSGCVDKLGIEKNEKGTTYTASSHWDKNKSDSNAPGRGRLNAVKGDWASDKDDQNGKRFWQACLNDVTLISGVFVQGQGFYSSYIQKFLVTYSYMEVDKDSTVGLHKYTSNGSLVIFNGPTNRYETNFYKLPTPIYARCLRLYVNCTVSSECAARFEFGGCKNVPLPSPMISWYQAKKFLACTISNAQPEDLDWFVFKQQITTNSSYKVQKSEYDYVKHGYKKVNVTILASLSSLIPKYRNCFDNKTRKTFYCSAEYSCRANFDGRNAKSQSETQVILVDFIEIPATPTNLDVQDIKSTSVKLAFSLNNDQKIFPIISYFLRISDGSQSKVKVFKNDDSGKIKLETFTPFTNYTVYIKSANEYHNSTEEKVSFQTDESASQPPFNLETSGKHLSWKKPKISNGIISSYFVQCVRSNGSEIINLEVKSNKLNTAVSELAPGLKYICKMRAFTKGDSIPGLWSSGVVMKVVETDPCLYALGMETNVIKDQQISSSNARLNNNKGWCTSSSGDITIDFGILVTLNGIAMQGDLTKKWSIDLKYAVADDFKQVSDATPGQSKRKFYHPGGNITKRHWFKDTALTLRKIKIHFDQGMCVKFEFYGCAEICSQQLKSPSKTTAGSLDIGDSKKDTSVSICLKQNSESNILSFLSVVSLSGLFIENHAESSVLGGFGVMYKRNISSNWTDLRNSAGEKMFQVNRHVPYMIYWFDIVHIQRLKIKSTIPICINITFLGCHSNCFNKLGIEKNINGLKFSSSSKFGDSQGPESSQLNRMKGDWSESTTPPVKPSWIQVCLPKSSYITGIALQGQGYWNDGQVNSFQLQYSFDGKQMFNYTVKGSQQMKLFQGTIQRYKTQVRFFPQEITARCLRLYTVKCNNGIPCSLRWEILGCNKGGIPSIDKISGQSPVQKGMNGEVASLISALPGVRIKWIFQGRDASLFSFHTFDWQNNNLTLEGKFMSKIVINKSISTYIIDNDIPCTINKSPDIITCRVKYICETYYPFSDGGKAMKEISVDFQGFNGFIAQPLITSYDYSNTSGTVTWKKQDDNMISGDFPLVSFEIILADKSTTLEKITLNKTTSVNYNYKFENLNPYSEYTISVVSSNRLHIRSKAATKSFTTLEGVPSHVTDLSVISKTKDSITLRWSAPTPANGIISKYLIEYKQRNASNTMFEEVIDVANAPTSKTIKNLKNFEYYVFKVKAFTNNGSLSGNWSSWLDVQTDEGTPTKPENVQGKIISKRSYKLTWETPSTLNGILKHFKVSYIGTKSYNDTFLHEGNHISAEKSTIISQLFPGTQYKFTVAGITGGGVGETSPINVELPVDIPYSPEIIRYENEMQSITFHLRPVPDLNGPIKFYQTDIQESGKLCFLNCTSKCNFLTRYLPTSIVIMKGLEDVQLPNGGLIQLDLIGKFILCFRAVTFHNSAYYGNTTSRIFKRSDLKRVSNESIDRGFKFIKVDLSNGPADTKYYQIVVAEGNITDLTINVSKLTPYIKSQDKPYITAEFLAKDFDQYKLFTIGDNKVFPKVSSFRYRRDTENQIHYKNRDLKPGTLYSVLQIAFQDKERYYTTPWMSAIKTRGTAPAVKPAPQDQTVLIVAVVVVLLLIIASTIFAVILYRRRRRPQWFKDTQNDYKSETTTLSAPEKSTTSFQEIGEDNVAMESDDGKVEDPLDKKPPKNVMKDSRYPPVKLSEFIKHFEKLKKDSSYLLSTEFKALNGGQQYKWNDAIKPEIKAKNRYANIVTYDHSRVKLHKSTANASDYVNASFIHGYSRDNMYIASQGPNDASVNDFWRMIWEKEIPCIIMLTNLVERGKRKCCLYWPERHSQTFGEIEVSTMESLSFSDCIIRKFCLRLVNSKEKQEVYQYHYLSWPDHGVPEFPSDIVNLRYKFRKVFPIQQTQRPILVHCSAGVGRTGTFIAVDNMLDLARQKKMVDIFNFVNYMRTRRIHMVQTEDQYSFVYRALAEAFTCGVTEINAADISIVTSRLLQPNQQGTKMNGYELQFNKLLKVIPKLGEEDTKIALKEENREKNRYSKILPRDDKRVVIFQSVYEEETSDYINASFVDGYKEPQAFIATQHPLDTTIVSFWKMISQFKVTTIVLLNRLYEADEVFPSFWPSSGDSFTFKDIKVKCDREDSSDDITTCKLHISNEKDATISFPCNLVHYKRWGGAQEVPATSISFMQFLQTVDKIKYKSKQRSPMVVICNDGVSRSGTFIASSIVMEYMKLEQSIDVFQAVRKIRSFRPEFVANAKQYKFIYDTMLCYIDSFNTYSNYTQ